MEHGFQRPKPAPSPARSPINDFGFDALAKLAKSSRGKNLMISPWSLQECFGMLRLGARGQTDKELVGFLKQSGTGVESAKSLQQLRQTLGPLLKTDQIRQANGLWLRKGSNLLPQFAKDVNTYFGAPVRETTFPQPALNDVNHFVSETTRGKIPKLFDQFDPESELVLVNAISFLDKWSVPFKKADTKNLAFTPPDKAAKQVPTMTGRGRYRYGKGEDWQAVTMPYKSGMSMMIVLPNKGTSLSQLLAKPNLLTTIENSSGMESGSVFIPRWKSEFSWNLKEWMKQQGVKNCFDPNTADFRGISQKRLFVGQAIQKTYIKVDEEGTEAAAATGIVMMPTAARPGAPFEFRADRPFAYFICSPNGVVLFGGVVNDPSA